MTTTGTNTENQNMILKADTLQATTITLGGTTLTPTAAEINTLSGVTSTVAELNKNDDSVVILTKGSGVSAMETYASGYFQNGGIKHTRILIDLTGLVGSGTDQDIIGNTGGAANCHLGQIVAAASGTIQGGSVTCLEVPAGGTADINFYSSSAATGAQDAAATGLAGVATLIDAGGSWTSGATKGMTALPAASDYIYIGNGAASGGTFSAGKFLINFYGT